MILLLTDYDKRFFLLFMRFCRRGKSWRRKTTIRNKFRNKTFPIFFRIQIIIKKWSQEKNRSLNSESLCCCLLASGGNSSKERKSNGNCFESHSFFHDDTRSRWNKIKHIIVVGGKLLHITEIGKLSRAWGRIFCFSFGSNNHRFIFFISCFEKEKNLG